MESERPFETACERPRYTASLRGSGLEPAVFALLEHVLDGRFVDQHARAAAHLQRPGERKPELHEGFRDSFLRAAAWYYLNARNRRGLPVDAVARFHLGNGARLERLNWLADTSERAMAQVRDEEHLFATLDAETNSIAIIVKHMAGNMRSRWTDFLSADGEKADRKRDTEFETDAADTRAAILERWEAGWRALFSALASLRDEDMERTIKIRGQDHTVPQAISRNVTHTAQHVGQIVFLAKHLAGESWKTLTIPRGKSEEFLQRMLAKRS